RWKESVADHSKAIDLVPNNLQLHLCRGRAYAHLEEWPKAAEDLSVVLKLPNAGENAWYEYALLRLQLGQKENDQKACAQMLERYGKTAKPATANLLAWTC